MNWKLKAVIQAILAILTLCSALVSVHGGLGLMTMRNILTGRIYEEMDGMIPYLELIIAGPTFLILLVILIKVSRSE